MSPIIDLNSRPKMRWPKHSYKPRAYMRGNRVQEFVNPWTGQAFVSSNVVSIKFTCFEFVNLF